MLTQRMEWEVTLGQVKGAGGQSAGSAACAEARPREAGLRKPGSAWRAGVRLERWLNWVRPSASQAWPLISWPWARLSFPSLGLHLPSIPRSKPSQHVGHCEAWRAARTLTLHRPGYVTSASSLLLPGFSGL